MVPTLEPRTSPSITRAASSLSMLIVEDDPVVLRSLELAVQFLGYTVNTARDGIVGMRKFRRCKPTIVLTDLVMPNMDGIEFVRAIRREKSDALIVAMSGGSIRRPDYLSMVLKLGADAAIEKPFAAEALHDVVTSLLHPEQRLAPVRTTII